MTKIPKAESKTVEFKTAFNQGGIKRIVDACKTHGYVDAEFMDLGSWFRVILRKTGDGNFVQPRKRGNHIVVTKSQKRSLKVSQKTPQKTPQKILSAIRQDPSIGTQEMADLIGVERSTVARAIAKLKSSGRLRRVGPDKGGYWEALGGTK